MEIIHTNEYRKFKFHYKNRVVNLKKVDMLAESMKKNNLLSIFPIVVNKKLEILDGQHRFHAARKAKVTLSYVVADSNYDIQNVAESNNFQSHWKFSDYVNYYAKDKLDPYIKLIELSNKYDVGVSGIANMGEDRTVASRMKTGQFEFADYDEVVAVLKFAREIFLEHGFTYWNKRPFLRAIRLVLKVKGFSRLGMHQKIRANRSMLVQKHTVQDYMKLLEDI